MNDGEGGGAIGYGVSWLLAGAIGQVGAWVVLGLLFVVGMLLYFNMTVGDLVAAWLHRREEREQLAAAEERLAARAPPTAGAHPGRAGRGGQPRHPGSDAQRARWGSG